jgi:hypothetical protein
VWSSSRGVAFAQLAAKRAIVNKFVNAKLSIFKRKLAPLLNLVSQSLSQSVSVSQSLSRQVLWLHGSAVMLGWCLLRMTAGSDSELARHQGVPSHRVVRQLDGNHHCAAQTHRGHHQSETGEWRGVVCVPNVPECAESCRCHVLFAAGLEPSRCVGD